MNKKIRFGIIGCSSIAKKSMIPAIKESHTADLQMLGSRFETTAKKFSKEFSCKSYGNYHEVLENNSVDAVYISLPPQLHEKWIIQAAKAGKHILCEKPATLSYTSAKKIVKECKKNNVRVMENFAFRLHPQHTKIFEILRKNTLGKIFSFYGKFGFTLPYSSKNFRFNKKLGGGVFNDVGCYLICASRLIFQCKPSSIFCYLQHNNSDVDLSGNICMKFPNNRLAIGVFSYESFFQSTYSIWGKKGHLNVERAFNIKKNMPGNITLNTANKLKKLIIKPSNQFLLQIQNFSNELNYGSSKFNFEKDLIEQAQIMDAGRKSNLKKRPVEI